jgi:LysM repeat protein
VCVATKNMRAIVARVEDARKSAVMAGIVPDSRHLGTGGYHVCLVHLRSHGKLGDYSSSRILDKTPKVTTAGAGYSCACDIGMSRADMIRTYAAVRKVWLDKTDPRRRFINAINCWKGSGDATRFNFQEGTSEYASPDHKTHIHIDQPRYYVDDHACGASLSAKAARAAASVVIGESKAAWLAREDPPKPAPGPKPAPATWKVAPGDTLFKIAAERKVTVAQLQAWNNLGKGTTIYPGQYIRLTAPPPKPAPAPKVTIPAWPVGSASYFKPKANPLHYVCVEQWQEAMKRHGWTITADGYLGPKSGTVVLAFQRAEGLKVTGVLDKATFVRAFTTTARGK